MRYELITIEQLTPNRKAVLVSLANGELHGCAVERASDGRVRRQDVSYETKGSVMRALQNVLDGNTYSEVIQVILAEGAYWPDVFPKITDLRQ